MSIKFQLKKSRIWWIGIFTFLVLSLFMFFLHHRNLPALDMEKLDDSYICATFVRASKDGSWTECKWMQHKLSQLKTSSRRALVGYGTSSSENPAFNFTVYLMKREEVGSKIKLSWKICCNSTCLTVNDMEWDGKSEALIARGDNWAFHIVNRKEVWR